MRWREIRVLVLEQLMMERRPLEESDVVDDFEIFVEVEATMLNEDASNYLSHFSIEEKRKVRVYQ